MFTLFGLAGAKYKLVLVSFFEVSRAENCYYFI